jgi:hypothetical protein
MSNGNGFRTAAEEAARQIAAKRRVVVVPAGEKKPRDDAWQKQHYAAEHFTTSSNIGLILGDASNGLIDVDLDCTQALELADAFLPPTEMEHGRASAPRSHRWYRTALPAPKTEQFRDPTDSKMLVELRGNKSNGEAGAQTNIPPSITTSSSTGVAEQLRWDKPDEPSIVDVAELQKAVRRLAAASLLARHWMEWNHDTNLALAGVLLRGEWDEEEVSDFIETVAAVAGDPEAAQRGRESVPTTAKRLVEGGDDNPVWGIPKLKELIGEQIASKVIDWLKVGDKRPKIAITTNMKQVIDQAEDALLAGEGIELYSRAHSLVRVLRGKPVETKKVKRPAGTPIVEAVGETHLRELMSSSARWVAETKKGPSATLPPTWAVQGLMQRGQWKFPRLEAVVETPFLRPDGSVCDKPGYDEVTAVLYEPSANFPLVPDWPTKEQAIDALVNLAYFTIDFLFVDECDRSALLAAILTVFARPAIDGPVPAYPFTAPTRGSGKSLLTDCISIIATGRRASRMAAPQSEEEARKTITSLLRQGARVPVIDDVQGVFGWAPFATLWTASIWQDRILGVSQMVELPNNATWLLSGNNITFKGDLGRRVVPCRIDPKMEHPEDRTGFTIQNLESYLHAERAKLVVDALTVLRAFVVAGRPGHSKPPKGSYEAWDQLVRACLIWLGMSDPLDSCDELRENADQDLEQTKALLKSWHALFGDKPKTIAQVIAKAEQTWGQYDKRFVNPVFRDALAAFDPKANSGRLSAHAIGNSIRRLNGRILSGLKFEKDSKISRDGIAAWRVVPAK